MGIEPGMYRHFKGSECEVICIAKDTETMEDMVVYRHPAADDGIIWVRPARMWFDHIERDGYSGPRFVKIEDDPIHQFFNQIKRI